MEAGDGYILSVPLLECIHVGDLEVIPADGADAFSISYVAYRKPTISYVQPKGCDFIPINPLAGNEVESGVCVCVAGWGHNATEYERYVTSAPPVDEGPGTEGGPYNRHTKW